MFTFTLMTPQAKTFLSEIRVYNSARDISVTFRGTVHPLDRTYREIIQKTDCLIFTDSQGKKCQLSWQAQSREIE